MFPRLLNLKWLQFRRSPAFTQQLGQTILLGLLFLYFAFNFVVLGVLAGKFLREEFPDDNIYLIIGGGLLYYFLFDLIMRIILQKYPVMDVKKYLHQNISKPSIIHYLLTTSMSSYFNLLPLFALVPFLIFNWNEMSGMGMAWPFTIVCLGMIPFNNYLSFAIDRYFRKENMWPYIFVAILVGLLFLDFNGYYSIRPHFDSIFSFLSGNVFTALIPIAGAMALYFWNFNILKSNLYIEDIVPEKVNTASNIHIGFFDRFGQAGKLMNLEVKLIWRNKRSRMILFMAFIFLLYPTIFMDSEAMRFDLLKYFIGLFVIGMFAMSYGQLMLSWNSTHFDLLATRNIKIEDIFKAKYYLLSLSCVVLYIFSLAYAFFNIEWLKIFTLMFLFNIGVSIFLYMFIAAYNSKRIDPGKGAMFNYEGINAAHFIIVFPLMILPVLIKWPFSAMGYPVVGDFVIGGIGLLGFIFHKQLIDLATRKFMDRRYKIMAAFRKKS